MKCMLMFFETAAERAQRDNPDTAPATGAYWGAWSSYAGAMAACGTMTSGNGLQPPELATTVRVQDGQRQSKTDLSPTRASTWVATSS